MKNLLNRLLLCMALVAVPALAEEAPLEEAPLDEVTLKNGSRILGTLTDVRDGVLTVETDFAGTLSISADQVSAVKANSALTLLMADSTVIEDVPLVVEDGRLLVESGTGYAVTDLAIVNPAPWELGEGYNWTGVVEAGLVIQRGNTDTDELNYKLESIWQSTRDRYTLKFQGEDDETNGQKSADNWRLNAKYDYFLEDPDYWGVQLLLEEDKFTDLKLRTLVGPYIGRQFLAEPILTFAAEVGIAYVDEDFVSVEDQDYMSATWAFKSTSDYLGADSQLYFDQTGIWNLDNTSDIIVKSIFGVSVPLLANISGAAEILLEYDSGVPDGIDELDQTYRFRLGYTW